MKQPIHVRLSKPTMLVAAAALAMALTAARPFSPVSDDRDQNAELAREVKEVATNEYPDTAKGKEADAELKAIADECGFDPGTTNPTGLSAECQEELVSWKAEVSNEVKALHQSTRYPGGGPDPTTVVSIVVTILGIIATIVFSPK